jgi:hypothetical protein
MPLLEIPDLSQADANQAADDLRIDAESVDVVAQGDGKFTVRATYPEGMVIPRPSTAADRDTFELNGLSQSAADAEADFFRDSDAAVNVVPEAGGLFTVRISPAKPPILVPPPAAPAAANAPNLAGYVLCLDRIRTERRPGKAYDRTVSRYQAFFDRTPIADIFGAAVERQGPGDNSQTGVEQHRRIAAGTYPLFTHASGETNKYRTIGYAQPANQARRPWPCLGIEQTGQRSGVLIHCAAGYLMGIGCINLTSNIADAQSNVVFSDSWARVVALIDSVRAHLGAAFPNGNNARLPNTSLVIRE